MRVLASLLFTAIACHASSNAAHAQYEFEDIDPGTVPATIEDVEEVVRGQRGALVTVDVRRPPGFQGFVEPLVFRFTPRGKDAVSVEVMRIDPPIYGRAGRAAGLERLRVPLLVPLDARDLKGARVNVVELSAWTGAVPSEVAPLELGRPVRETSFDPEFQKSMARTTVPVANLCEHAVDFVLEAKFTSPERATTLVRGSVAAGARTELVLRSLPTGANELMGADVQSVELVDWSIVVDRGEDEARGLLEQAWDTMYSVPANRLPLASRFVWEFRSKDIETRIEGRLVLSSDGKVQVALDEGPDATRERTVGTDLEQILWAATRPPLDEVLEGEPRLVRRGERTVVSTDRPLFEHDLSGEVAYVLANGAIVAHDKDALAGERGGSLPVRWRWSAGPEPRLLGRKQSLISNVPAAVREVTLGWLRVGDALWLPASASEVTSEWAPGMGKRTSVAFSDWGPAKGEIGVGEAPSGALADTVRAAWDGFYRYPTTEAGIRADFRAKGPGTDGVWIGRRDVRGALELVDMRGGFWAESSADVREKRASEDERSVLGTAVLDRVLMWSGRDICREPRFDAAFAGASLTEEGRWIVVEGGTIAALRLEEGRVAATRSRFGQEVEYRWKEVSGALVPEVRSSGEETVTIRWREWRDGWMFPLRVDFEKVFGADWGPESLEFSAVEITPEER